MLTATSLSLRCATRLITRRPAVLTAAGTSNMLQRRNYHEAVVEHYENPRNVGSFDKNDDDVGTVGCSLFLLSI